LNEFKVDFYFLLIFGCLTPQIYRQIKEEVSQISNESVSEVLIIDNQQVIRQ